VETIVLVGTPDTGKTNFLARLWETLRSRRGALVCPTPPTDIKYVEDALGHIMHGHFAPRSNKNIDESRSDVAIAVRVANGSEPLECELLIPDVTGELWRTAVETFEAPRQWMDDLKGASGAMLFVRVLSGEVVAPLDWVTAREILRHNAAIPPDKDGIPTQVQLCELLRFLELTLIPHEDGTPPRVALIVTAYDLLDGQSSSSGPMTYLEREYPLLFGKLQNHGRLDVQVFGASVVGGDLGADEEFRNHFLDGEVGKFGYVVKHEKGRWIREPDISLPVLWLITGRGG
jgi:Double-GTPase 1